MKINRETDNLIKKNNAKNFSAFLVLILAVVCFVGGYFFNLIIKGDDLRTVEWVLDTVNKYGYYLDEDTGELKKLTGKEVADSIVNTFLDDYSNYYTADEYSDVVETNKGNNFGVGVSLLSSTTDLKIFRVIGNSPAYYSGLKSGDILVGAKKVDGDRQEFISRKDFTDFLSSVERDEEFILFATRDGVENSFTVAKRVFISSFVTYFDNQTKGYFTVAGGSLAFTTEASLEMQSLPDGVAYIGYQSFTGKSDYEIKTVMEYIKAQGKTGVILDLRDNGGGQMKILESVSSYFIKKDGVENPVIVKAKDNDGRWENYTAKGSNFVDSVEKVVVLANKYTASASECLIGAMLHYGKAFSRSNLVIENGDGMTGRTYGKGIMQTTFKNTFTGEALKITTARLYFPDGKTSIHGKGIHTVALNMVLPQNALDRAIELFND